MHGAVEMIGRTEPAPALATLTHGGPPRWGDALPTRIQFGRDDGPFAVDVLTQPESNPWLCQMRLTGLDFLPGGKQAVLCTWDGDVWQVDGIEDRSGESRRGGGSRRDCFSRWVSRWSTGRSTSPAATRS